MRMLWTFTVMHNTLLSLLGYYYYYYYYYYYFT